VGKGSQNKSHNDLIFLGIIAKKNPNFAYTDFFPDVYTAYPQFAHNLSILWGCEIKAHNILTKTTRVT